MSMLNFKNQKNLFLFLVVGIFFSQPFVSAPEGDTNQTPTLENTGQSTELLKIQSETKNELDQAILNQEKQRTKIMQLEEKERESVALQAALRAAAEAQRAAERAAAELDAERVAHQASLLENINLARENLGLARQINVALSQ